MEFADPIPPGGADCHFHVFGRRREFPYASGLDYAPPDVDEGDYRAARSRWGCDRGVVVETTAKGGGRLQAALEALGPRYRGVALARPDLTDTDLDALDRAGVRALRVKVFPGQTLDTESTRELARRIAPRGWHIELWLPSPEIARTVHVLGDLDTDVVIDHFGNPRPSAGPGQPGFAALLDLVRAGRTWVKLAAAYRLSEVAPPHTDLDAFARALVEAAPGRLVWGSDWPHPASRWDAPGAAALRNELERWVPDAGLRYRILVDNPARPYGLPG